MRRREFIALLGAVAGPSLLWTLGARVALAGEASGQRGDSKVQAGRSYRAGFLTAGMGPSPLELEFVAALAAVGYQEGRNLTIERRYAAGDLARLTELARELVGAKVDVIVTEATPAAIAAKKATSQIPIVMATSGDPIGAGLIASLARPGGNVTGLTTLAPELDRKRVELLRELVPHARLVAFFGNNQNPSEQIGFRGVQKLAAEIGIDSIFINAPFPAGFETAFASIASAGADVVLVTPTPTNIEARSQIIANANRYRLPAVYGTREFAEDGGLVAYGTSRLALSRRAAVFVDKILKGTSAAELPVEQPTKFELVINLRAAKAAGLTISDALLARADEVIE
jgi:putative ABC transport system substrate-binding protein